MSLAFHSSQSGNQPSLTIFPIKFAVAVRFCFHFEVSLCCPFFKFYKLWDTANIKNGRVSGAGDCPKGQAGGERGKTSSFEKSHVRGSGDCCLSLERCTVSLRLYDSALNLRGGLGCKIIRKISHLPPDCPPFPFARVLSALSLSLSLLVLSLFFQVLGWLCYRHNPSSSLPPGPGCAAARRQEQEQVQSPPPPFILAD